MQQALTFKRTVKPFFYKLNEKVKAIKPVSYSLAMHICLELLSSFLISKDSYQQAQSKLPLDAIGWTFNQLEQRNVRTFFEKLFLPKGTVI